MSKLDIINDEIARRENSNVDLITGQAALKEAVEQFNKLDEMYRADEKAARDILESVYSETQHFTGKNPIVYSFGLTEFYPFFNGETDIQCNPYFPISKVKDGTFDGLEPLEALPTKTDGHVRDRNYSGTIEPTLRAAAIAGLAAFPDTSDETGTGSCDGETPPGSGTNETICIANGGTWTDPEYGPGDTATEKLRAVLDPWKAEIIAIQGDLYNDVGSVEDTFWQGILDDIQTVLDAVQVDVTYPAQTADFVASSPEDIARDALIAADPGITSHVNARVAELSTTTTEEEQNFFGVIRLRLHQANGSFAKLRAAKGQENTTNSIIADNNAAIKSLNVLKVKNS